MQRTTILLATAVAVSTLCGNQAWACPHCNIHNYLAESVRSSTNIFQGTVVRQIDEQTAEVEVLKVLRGKHEVGSKVTTKMYGSERYLGKKFIFSDPTSWPPTFEVLPLELEDEVVFLIQKKRPSITSVPEAITRVQGISVKTQGIGMEYLTSHYDEAAGPLVAELEKLMPAVFSNEDVFFGEHRLGKLLQALLSRDSSPAREFALAYIGKLGTPDEKKIDWNALPSKASSRGVFLQDMLFHSEKQAKLSATLRQQLMARLPNLSGQTQADAVYALVASEAESPNAVQAAMKTDDSSANMLAAGLYFAGNFKARWWAHDEAYAFWEKALAVAKQEELRAAISERLARAEKSSKRKKDDGN